MLFMFPHRVFAFLLLISIFSFTTNAASIDDAALSALSQIPACALQCINEKLPAIGCTLLDIECQCTSKNSTKILQPCLEKQCSYNETFATLRAQASICDRPHDNRSTPIRIVAYVTGIIPIIVIVMRFASRYVGGNQLWWDDWLHLAAVILVIPLTASLFMNLKAGIGHHIWDLTYPRVVAIGKWTYIATILWGLELLLIKYSILCLYIRIFPNVWLKRAVWAFMAFTALFTLPLIFLAAFQCIPVRAIWDLQEQGTAKCIDYMAVLRLTVVYEIIAETILFSLPIPIVWKLQMETAKKIQLLFFFSLGIWQVFVIVMSIIRLPFLPGVVDTTDPTYTVTGTSITGFVSSGVAHVCAAVPTIRNLIRFCRNGFRMPTKASSGYAKDTGSYNSSSKRSYKSLEDKKNDFVTAQQRSKASSRDKKDPYRLSAIMETEIDGRVVELQEMDSSTHADALDDEGCVGEQSESGLTRRGDEGIPTIVRKSPSPGLEDSASQKSILHQHSYV
ncbi:cfem domain-containing protein [Stemphylium lycopersici]|nr:cfem domain-containing protein [Stemphylium lycopersici]